MINSEYQDLEDLIRLLSLFPLLKYEVCSKKMYRKYLPALMYLGNLELQYISSEY